MTRRTMLWSQWLIAAAVLTFTAHWARSVPWGELAGSVRAASLPLVAVSIAAYLATVVLRALAWAPLLGGIGVPSVWLAVRGSIVMHALNCVVVGNAGEAGRVVVVTRASSTGATAVGATIVVERLVVTAVHTVMAVFVGAMLTLPRELATYRWIALGAIAAGAVVMASMLRCESRRTRSERRSAQPMGRVRRIAREFVQALRTVSSARRLATSFVFATLMWWCGVASAHWAAMAMGYQITVAESAAAFLMVSVGSIVRATPANVGVTQLVYVSTASMLGLPAAGAAGVALLLQLIQTVPVLVVGVPFLPGLWHSDVSERGHHDSRPARVPCAESP